MASRTATEELRVMLDPETYRALREHATLRQESVAAVVRRFITRGLVAVSGDAQSQALADAVRAVIRDEIRPTRHYAYLAAREAAAAHRFGVGIISTIVGDVLRRPPERVERARDQADSAAMRYAAQHLQDLEPDDPVLDAPAEPLPGPEDEVTVEDGDTASMIEGA